MIRENRARKNRSSGQLSWEVLSLSLYGRCFSFCLREDLLYLRLSQRSMKVFDILWKSIREVLALRDLIEGVPDQILDKE
ncbi:unnamed protein product [Dovyalis caffra]|uniref:Uncharacterized protein n=1 Tax=Dovyalis caffra TaxID=77055 RepID=A0AAV1R4D1_9ROSI|nr:unnamed protein product [Dovyalis caffra]